MNKAFSLLEVVLVITILGIVASISSSLIANTYESYLVQKSQHSASIKTEVAATLIANRLSYRISSSVIAKERGTANIRDIDNLTDGNTFKVLEWIGYDNDSFSALPIPGWSGFCDVTRTSRGMINTPGSSLVNNASPIIAFLGAINGAATTIANAAIIFEGREYSLFRNYSPTCMGLGDPADVGCISPITSVGATTINVSDINPKIVSDRYKLAWSAYAIVPGDVNTSTNTFDLRLHYNYQPWEGEVYTDGSSSLIAQGITSFTFVGQGDTVRFKICAREEIGLDFNNSRDHLGVCKEKAVIR
jgi:prepilin-type N-terminal cleavage/methylation domain-containing protein